MLIQHRFSVLRVKSKIYFSKKMFYLTKICQICDLSSWWFDVPLLGVHMNYMICVFPHWLKLQQTVEKKADTLTYLHTVMFPLSSSPSTSALSFFFGENTLMMRQALKQSFLKKNNNNNKKKTHWKCLWEVAASGCKRKNSLVCFSIQDFFCDKFHESNPLKNINNWKEMSTGRVKTKQKAAQWRVFLWVKCLQLRGACFRMCCLFDCLFTVCQLSQVLYCTSLCVDSTRSSWRLQDFLSFPALWDARPHKG